LQKGHTSFCATLSPNVVIGSKFIRVTEGMMGD
jgi:hypothetical protein